MNETDSKLWYKWKELYLKQFSFTPNCFFKFGAAIKKICLTISNNGENN